MSCTQLEMSFGGPASPEVEPIPVNLPEPLAKDFRLLSNEQRDLMIALCSSEGDRVNHLFEGWMKSDVGGSTPAYRRRLVSQLEKIDASYSSGIVGYLNNARCLLEEKNHLKGWKPIAPQGEAFNVGDEDYSDVETLGMRELGAVGFVVAAGFSGEGLGVGICRPNELATGTTYLQLYIESILAIENKHTKGGRKLPLCIMTSDATNEDIVKLLEDNDYFGMTQEQITIVDQGTGVPSLSCSDSKVILNTADQFNILTETHGQGDVHSLLHKYKVAKKWSDDGIQWAVFLQDANGLAFHNLALMLGVSMKHSLVMNMLAYPRKAKEAVESIVKLINDETNETRTVSVDYEQFDPLLRSSGHTFGDQKEDATGFSPFPGSTNQFVFKLDRYLATLERTNGIMPEFVAKAENDTSAHLECRMQDISSVLSGRDALKVGYTCVPTEHCFSPVDTTAENGSIRQRTGLSPRCASSAEADQYAAHTKLMRSIGCVIEDSGTQTFHGVTVAVGPQIVIKPDAACFPSDYATLFPNPEKIKISSRSSLVVSGPGIVIESLELDGALVIEGKEGLEEQVIENLVVKNDGWSIVEDDDSVVEDVAMRGYRLEKKGTKTAVFSETFLDTVTRLSTCG